MQPDEWSDDEFGNQKNLAYEVCQTLMKVVPFEDNGLCSRSDTEVVNKLVSGSSPDTVY